MNDAFKCNNQKNIFLYYIFQRMFISPSIFWVKRIQKLNFQKLCFPHLEQEGISDRVAEAKDKVFLGVFRYRLDNAVLHPKSMFGNTVIVDA